MLPHLAPCLLLEIKDAGSRLLDECKGNTLSKETMGSFSACLPALSAFDLGFDLGLAQGLDLSR